MAPPTHTGITYPMPRHHHRMFTCLLQHLLPNWARPTYPNAWAYCHHHTLEPVTHAWAGGMQCHSTLTMVAQQPTITNNNNTHCHQTTTNKHQEGNHTSLSPTLPTQYPMLTSRDEMRRIMKMNEINIEISNVMHISHIRISVRKNRHTKCFIITHNTHNRREICIFENTVYMMRMNKCE